MPPEPTVSVIVASYRRFGPLLDTLRDLLAQDYPRTEILVADQNPGWPPEWRARKEGIAADPGVWWLTLDRPGVVAARNAAAARATGDVLLFVDDDVAIPDPAFVRNHLRNYACAELAAVAGREFDGQGKDVAAMASAIRASIAGEIRGATGEPDDWSGRDPLAQCLGFDRERCARRTWVAMFCTCNGSVRRGVFAAMGGFDESFSGNAYGDDFDLALRMHGRGYRLLYDPAAWLIHLRAPVGGLRVADAGNAFSHRERALSRCLFFVRYARRGWRWRLFWQALRTTVLVKGNFRNPAQVAAAAAGFVSALAEALRRNRTGAVPGVQSAGSRAGKTG